MPVAPCQQVESPACTGGVAGAEVAVDRPDRAVSRGVAPNPRPGVAGTRWKVEDSFAGSKELAALDEHQVRGWRPWHRWSVLAMLAHAFLSVLTAQETVNDTNRTPSSDLIPLTCNEIRRLFTGLLTRVHPAPFQLAWSRWRRRHQATARACHYKRRGDQLTRRGGARTASLHGQVGDDPPCDVVEGIRRRPSRTATPRRSRAGRRRRKGRPGSRSRAAVVTCPRPGLGRVADHVRAPPQSPPQVPAHGPWQHEPLATGLVGVFRGTTVVQAVLLRGRPCPA